MNIEIKIEKLVFGGNGLGFVDGKAVFVEGALPGEKVLARIVNEKRNYSKARLLKIIEASPARMEPPCAYIRSCGGCQYQHITYPQELQWKEEQVRESFMQALHLDSTLISPIRSGSNEYAYRTSITLHRTQKKNNKPQRLAFIGRDNRSSIFIDHCLIAANGLKPVFTSEYQLEKNEEKRVFKVGADERVVSSDGEMNYQVKIGQVSFWTNSKGFFQNNLEITELIGKQLAEWVDKMKPACFLDLCSGVGTFSILAAARVPQIFCFEENPWSIACLKKNFRELQIPLAGVLTGRVEKTLPAFMLNLKENPLVFLDPPRQGIEPSLAQFLSHSEKFGNIFYLACDLQILIRDLRILLAQGHYEIKSVIPFDMFPRTKHIEVLVWLKRISQKDGAL